MRRNPSLFVLAALLTAPLTVVPLGEASASGAVEPVPLDKLAVRDIREAATQARPRPQQVRSAAATAAVLDCEAYNAEGVTYLADRTVFHIASAGASSVTISRQRHSGALLRLVTGLPGTRAEYVDLTASRASLPKYTLTFSFSDGSSKTCVAQDVVQHPEDIVVGSEEGQIGAMGFRTNPSSLAARDSFSPAHSPDGRWLGYSAPGAAGGLDVYIRRADGTGRGMALPSTSGNDVEVAFSFDGRFAVYTSYGDVESRLKVVDLNTGVLRDVPSSVHLAEAVWTADGRLLATDYTSEMAPLVFVNPSTGARSALGGSAGGWSPDTAADGTIAYAGYNEATGFDEVRVVRGGATAVTEVLPADSFAFAVRLSASTVDRVVFIEAAATFDETTGDLLDYTAAVKADDIGVDNPAESIEGTRPMAMPAWLDVRAPRSTGTSDFTGDRRNDVLARDRDGVLWVYRGLDGVNNSPTLGNRVRVGGGWHVMNAFVAAGDMNSDGRADVLARDTSGVLWLYPGTGRLAPVLGTRVRVSGGWGSYVVVAGGDYNGDVTADIVARDSSGHLWLYPGTGTGGRGGAALGARTLIGKGWNGMNALVAVGDANGDNKPDLYARDRATNMGYLYPGTGAGTFGPRRSLGHTMGENAYVGIENHPNENDGVTLIGRLPDGGLHTHWFRGEGVIDGGWMISRGWQGYTITG